MNGIYECIHQVLGNMRCTSELKVTDPSNPHIIKDTLLMPHGLLATPTTQYFNLHLTQQYSIGKCFLGYLLLPNGPRLETIDKNKYVAISKVKT